MGPTRNVVVMFIQAYGTNPWFVVCPSISNDSNAYESTQIRRCSGEHSCQLDDSDADVDSAGSYYGEIADRYRAALLEGKAQGDIPRDEMEWARSGERGFDAP